MRIVIKGGVWRNTEDEILKAAISKYGKNQWARISSLLVRKTPKQCKARWYEWLDPSIKKTEWSKEEDEKLLHLAKLMPTQWRTISSMVGRTAAQCLERYQQLLDDAESRDNSELGLTGPGAEAGPSADDVRKLRPGDVDPDPEYRPARPDPVDMDEDEKEMLSEARARLANTQGKKAKRKARERQLEEARRLAMLQKRRELKAAGIMTRPKVKRKGIDLMADIPYEKQPLPGFYDTSEEDARDARAKAPVGKTLRELEGKRKKENQEDVERRKRQKKAQETKNAEAHFQPEKDLQIQRLKEAEQINNRRKLTLPEPQVGDSELDEIAKLGQSGQSARELVEAGDNEASQGLLGDYTGLEHAQHARTPRTAPQADNVMSEARNLRNMTMSQTPLYGEENTPLHQVTGRGSGFEGATPRHVTAETPNPLATPMRSTNDVEATPRTDTTGRTPLRTPRRDNLSINAADGTAGETPVNERQLSDQKSNRLMKGFESLPKPRNDFELVDPDEVPKQEEEEDTVEKRKEDAATRDARLERERKEEQERRLARRSQAVKRNLPRPTEIDEESIRAGMMKRGAQMDANAEAERLVMLEMVDLLEHDAVAYPVAGGSKVPSDKKTDLPIIEDERLQNARDLVHGEFAQQVGYPGATPDALFRIVSNQADLSAFDKTWKPEMDSLVYDAKTKSFVDASSLNKGDRIKGLTAQIEATRQRFTKDNQRAAKLEKRLNTMLGGYQNVAGGLSTKLKTTDDAYEDLSRDLESLKVLSVNEQAAASFRLEALRGEVDKLERKEREGQDRYKELSVEKEQLTDIIKAADEELMMREAEAANEAALAVEG